MFFFAIHLTTYRGGSLLAHGLISGCGGFMKKSEACIGGNAAITGADYDELRDGIDKILEHWNLF